MSTSSEIKGIGDGAPDGWVIEEYVVPMPKRLDDILTEVRTILQRGRVQTVRLANGHPITFTRFVKQDEAAQKLKEEEVGGVGLGDVARNVIMDEYALPPDSSSLQAFLYMMLSVEARRLHLTHIGTGSNTRLFEWLGIDRIAYGSIENIGGAEIVRDGEIPDDILIFFGSPYRSGRIDQITYAIKVHMFLEGEDLPEEEDGSET